MRLNYIYIYVMMPTSGAQTVLPSSGGALILYLFYTYFIQTVLPSSGGALAPRVFAAADLSGVRLSPIATDPLTAKTEGAATVRELIKYKYKV